MNEQLRIEIRNGIEPIEVSLIGDVDMATEQQVIEALSGIAAQAVIVDLSHVGFLDSSGIRALVVGHRVREPPAVRWRCGPPRPRWPRCWS